MQTAFFCGKSASACSHAAVSQSAPSFTAIAIASGKAENACFTAPGMAAVVSPAPARRQAAVLSNAAPVYAPLPTQSSARPFLPLCESIGRFGNSRALSSFAMSQTSSCSSESFASSGSSDSGWRITSPQHPRPGKSSCPRLKNANVTVWLACTALPRITPLVASTPDGMSTATTGFPLALISAIASA